MTRLLSLPPELLHEIIQLCPQRERCQLRSTCKTLNELADPIVFRRLQFHHAHSLLASEHRILALKSRSSKACEYTKTLEIDWIPDVPHKATEQSRPYFKNNSDLRGQLPAAISALRNMTHFKWRIYYNYPNWLIDLLMRAVTRLPQLTGLDVEISNSCQVGIPLGRFANLTSLSVANGRNGDASLFISQLSTAIAASPQLRTLHVSCWGYRRLLPTMGGLFENLSTTNPLRLEHLGIEFMDATVDRSLTLPHFTRLTSFHFQMNDDHAIVARRVWKSFMANGIKLTDVSIEGVINEEAMLYLSSFSGLKKLIFEEIEAPSEIISEKLQNMLLSEVLPKHVDSLQTLKIYGDDDTDWVFDHETSKSILKCVKLRDLHVCINEGEDGMPVQDLLDTVARLPELKVFHFQIFIRSRNWDDGMANFKPTQGLRYVEEVEVGDEWYVLERNGERPVRYRHIRVI